MEFTIPWEEFVHSFKRKGKTGIQQQLLTDNRRELRIKQARRCHKCGTRSSTMAVIPNTAWQKHKEAIGKLAAKQTDQPPVPLPCPVLVRVTLYPPHGRADTLGLAKILLDALEGVAYENDRQVKGTIWKAPPVAPAHVDEHWPRVVINVEPYE